MQRFVIRALDIAGATGGLILTLPILAVLAILVKATSSGPAIFAQKRVGRCERPFTCLKLRTMSLGTPVAGSHEVSAAAVTSIGRVLRRLKLDELPQLWNVIRGEMSLVGPRPGLPIQLDLLEARRRHAVYAVRPGVTGPGQVAGVDMSRPELLAELDGTYACQPTVKAYLRYIWMTLIGHGRGDRVAG